MGNGDQNYYRNEAQWLLILNMKYVIMLTLNLSASIVQRIISHGLQTLVCHSLSHNFYNTTDE